jgi:lipopolysaccharide transport system permease protein
MLKKAKEIYAYRQMLESLVLTDLRTRYKGSFIGFFWTLLNPLLLLIVYSIVFKYVVRIQLENYTAYLFIGLISWSILSQAITAGAGAIVRNAGLVKKIYFPKEILPLSVVAGGMVNFLFSLIVLIPILVFSKITVGWPLLMFPLVLLVYFIFTISFTLLISGLNVYFRDLEHIMGILVMVWFYLTPIVFPSNMIPKEIGFIFEYNPMKIIIESFHQILFYNEFPSVIALLKVGLFSIVFLIISLKIFNKLSRNFAEAI